MSQYSLIPSDTVRSNASKSEVPITLFFFFQNEGVIVELSGWK